MTPVYHFRPHNLLGDTLYPLNQLKIKHPELYEAHRRKYQGREFLLTTEIPPLDCLWNDVLHFSPVHPEKIRDALLKLGYQWQAKDCFVVDSEAFTSADTVYYFSGKSMKERIYEPFGGERLETMRDLPEDTLAYYLKMRKEGKQPLLFAYVPHILHRGTIAIEPLETLRLE